MSPDQIIGPMGTAIRSDVGALLADADAATTIEQVRSARAACMVTRTGHLIRTTDLDHDDPGPSAAFLRDHVHVHADDSVTVEVML